MCVLIVQIQTQHEVVQPHPFLLLVSSPLSGTSRPFEFNDVTKESRTSGENGEILFCTLLVLFNLPSLEKCSNETTTTKMWLGRLVTEEQCAAQLSMEEVLHKELTRLSLPPPSIMCSETNVHKIHNPISGGLVARHHTVRPTV